MVGLLDQSKETPQDEGEHKDDAAYQGYRKQFAH